MLLVRQEGKCRCCMESACILKAVGETGGNSVPSFYAKKQKWFECTRSFPSFILAADTQNLWNPWYISFILKIAASWQFSEGPVWIHPLLFVGSFVVAALQFSHFQSCTCILHCGARVFCIPASKTSAESHFLGHKGPNLDKTGWVAPLVILLHKGLI